MAFYDLSKEQRAAFALKVNGQTEAALKKKNGSELEPYLSDPDTYIRKTAYLAIGKVVKEQPALLPAAVHLITGWMEHEDFKVRQTAVNAAGEIGKWDFETVAFIFDTGLFDEHHSIRNAVIGSVKKMGEKNPKPVLKWAGTYLKHEQAEVRREICHGIELRGRTHPQDILPMLKSLQFDKTARVKNTLVHVLGQIAYKKGCLETVVAHLETWDNKELVSKALSEIIDVHNRYSDFAVLTQKQASDYIRKHSTINPS